jgi:hypothetical protein
VNPSGLFVWELDEEYSFTFLSLGKGQSFAHFPFLLFTYFAAQSCFPLEGHF